MDRKTDIIPITTIDQVPMPETIRAIPRARRLKLVFNDTMQGQKVVIGQNLKEQLTGFQIGVHIAEPEITIAKLITDKEIEENQDFFEQCAKDYRQLAQELLFKLVDHLHLELNKDFPMETFNKLKLDKRQTGLVEGWKYFIHGFHCGFEHNKTRQIIEVPLVFGCEFGDLDPYFFSKFIKSTPAYQPLPVAIFEDYADGARINDKMIALGKFERISSNIENHYGIAVADRQKVIIKSYWDLNKLYEEQNKRIKKAKFGFWKFRKQKK